MKIDFRIKFDGTPRAVSYNRIEGSYVGGDKDTYYVDQKGVRTMVRQYLKSLMKSTYEKDLKLEYFAKENKLRVGIKGVTQEEASAFNKTFGRFITGNTYYDVNDRTKIISNVGEIYVVNVPKDGSADPDHQEPKKPTEKKQHDLPKKEEEKSTTSSLPKIKNIEIIWSEYDIEDGTTVTSWTAFQEILDGIYKKYVKSKDGGYVKNKVGFMWTDGSYMVDRIDVSTSKSDYQNEQLSGPIGEYLKNKKEAAYTSSFQKGRLSVSWSDTNEQKQEKKKEHSAPDKPQHNSKKEGKKLYMMGKILDQNQFEAVYGPSWRDELDWVPEMDVLFGQNLSKEETKAVSLGVSVEVQDKMGSFWFISPEQTTSLLVNKYPKEYTLEEFAKIKKGLDILAQFGDKVAERQLTAIMIYATFIPTK